MKIITRFAILFWLRSCFYGIRPAAARFHAIAVLSFLFGNAFIQSGKAQHTLTQQNITTIKTANTAVEIYDNKFDNAGNQYVCGWFRGNNVSFGNGKTATSNAGSRDIFLAKYNASNVCQWVAGVGSSSELDEGHNLAIDNLNGRVLLTGDIYGEGINFNPLGSTPIVVDALFETNSATPQPTAGFFLSSFSTSNGQCAWAFSPRENSTSWRANQLTSIHDVNFKQVLADPSGDVYLAGGLFMNPDFNPDPVLSANFNIGEGGTFLAKYTKDGNFIYAQPIVPTGGTSVSFLGSMHLASFGNEKAIVLAGIDDNQGYNSNPPEAYVCKVNPADGNVTWINRYLSRGIVDPATTSATSDLSGNAYFSSIAPDFKPSIRKIDWAGNTIKEKINVSNDIDYHTELAWNPVNGFLYGVATANGSRLISASCHIETIDPATIEKRGQTEYPITGLFQSVAFTSSGDAVIAGSFTSAQIALGGTGVNKVGIRDGFLARISACITPSIQAVGGPGYNICAGNTYTYQIPPVTNATSYQWIVPPGWNIVSSTPSSNNSIQLVGGPTPVTLSVKAIGSCFSTTNTSFFISPFLPTPTITGNNLFCRNTENTLTIDPVPEALSYEWTLTGGGSLSGVEPTSTSVTVQSGTYGPPYPLPTLQVRAIGACANSQIASRSLNFQPPAPEFISVSTNVEPCIGAQTTGTLRPISNGTPTNTSMTFIQEESSMPDDWNYIQYFGFVTGDAFTFEVTPNSPGNASFKYKAENSCGSAFVTVNYTSSQTPVLHYLDNDQDGKGDPNNSEMRCLSSDPFWVLNGDDCDDNNPAVFQERVWFIDEDGDGFGNSDVFLLSCTNPSGSMPNAYVTVSGDCDDNNPAARLPIWYADYDGDGFGRPEEFLITCNNPSTPELAYVQNGRDCSDADPNISPRQAEIQTDGIDNDCDGFTDEGEDPPGTTYCDIDGDGFGDPGCPIPPAGSLSKMKNGVLVILTSNDGVANNTDCDDNNPNINPQQLDFANGKDDDCNGISDDTISTNLQVWYQDNDGDGYGQNNNTLLAETQPQGYVAQGNDCNDANPNVNPGANEICGNGTDDNCNGQTDENNPVAINPATDKQICAEVQLPAISLGSGAFAQWTNSNPGIGLAASGMGQNLPSFAAVNTNSQPAIASITVIPFRYNADSTTCSGQSYSFTITINPKPNISAGADVSIGAGQSTNLNATGASSYQWSPLTGLNPANGIGAAVVASPVQTTLYTVTGTDLNNCTATDQILVTVSSSSGPLEPPVISPATGTYSSPQQVVLSAAAGTTIYYTTSGNVPRLDVPNGFTKLYTGPFTVQKTTTIRAIATKAGSGNSPVAVFFLTISNPTVCETPVFNPGAGSFEGLVTVSISSATNDAQIWYTTNGNNPRFDVPNSFTKLYSGALTFSASVTIKAVATKAGLSNSAMLTGNFVVSNPGIVGNPVFSPAPGNYPTTQTVGISSTTAEAQIFYTTNGNSPRFDVPNSFTKTYTGPIVLTKSTTLKAVARKPGFANSGISVGIYSIGPARMSFDEGASNYYFESGENEDIEHVAHIKLVPNPGRGKFRILLENSREAGEISVTNMLGQMVWNGKTEESQNELEFDISNQPAGIYLLRFQGKTLSKVIRIIKQ